MNDFLPKNYQVPEKPGNYMKLAQGENKFRILSEPILGRVWWVREDGTVKERNEKPKKGDKPVRIRMSEELTPDQFNAARHFWAMVVWNYKTETVQILEITQSTIQKPLTALVKSKGWGSPVGVDGYDIAVTKTGEMLDTEYQVMPQPKKKIDEGIVKMAEDMEINLEALYDGGDPFGTEDEAEELAEEASKKV